MAQAHISGNDYQTLQVDTTATPRTIRNSYRRLALRLHPDRNKQRDATQAFQRLGRAYETLKDPNKRREYDRYVSNLRFPQAPTTRAAPLTEAAQLAALERAKKERCERWQATKRIFEAAISQQEGECLALEQAIRELHRVLAAEAATEAWEKGWLRWTISPLTGKCSQDSEVEKARKVLRAHELTSIKDTKKELLRLKEVEITQQRIILDMARLDFEAAIAGDNLNIANMHSRIFARYVQAKQERDRVQWERAAAARRRQKEHEEHVQASLEALRKKLSQQTRRDGTEQPRAP